MRMKPPRLTLILPLVALATLTWMFREPLRRHVEERGILANEAPPVDAVREFIEHAPHSSAVLLAAWKSGKIAHREAAILSFAQVFPAGTPLPPEFEDLLLSAALDADLNVRESALELLERRSDPALPGLAAEQLKDFDIQVRLLGLNHLKSVKPAIGVPMVVPFLDDADPFVVTTALKLLERWNGQNFGVRLSETTSFENEQTGLQEYRAGSSDKARAGAERAKIWWAAHRTGFSSMPLEVPTRTGAGAQLLSAPDFQLRTLDGQKVRLSEFRGKVVLINFWTTWCSACLSEMPELIALQREHQDNLVILGISLDYVPDEHGHVGGHSAAEKPAHDDDRNNGAEQKVEALAKLRDKIARTVKARGINYPVLLDERNEAGGRYNGGELPTTVIVDAKGNVRRRFVGARSLQVFQAMLSEAAQAPVSISHSRDD